MHRLSDYIKEIKNKVTDEETHSQTFEIFQYLYQWHNEIIEILCTRWVCTLKQKMRRHFWNDFRTPPLSRNRQKRFSNPKFILRLEAKTITQWETKLLTVLHFTENILLISLLSSFSTGSHATLMSLVEKERLNWIELNWKLTNVNDVISLISRFTCTGFAVTLESIKAATGVRPFSVITRRINMAIVCVRTGAFINIY